MRYLRPQLAHRRIVWGSEETKIFCHNPVNNGKIEVLGRYGWPDCASSWTWPVAEGTDVKVEVELLLNGQSFGRAATENWNATFHVPYTNGELTALSYDGDTEISRDSVRSAGIAAGLKITPDKTVMTANGEALCFALVEIVDENGAPVPYAEAKVTAMVDGAATLQAFGSARPITEENYTKGIGTAYQGKLLAVVRAGQHTGEAVLRVYAEGLSTTECTLSVR